MRDTKASFRADFPYDSVERDGDFVLFPGRNIAQFIAEQLRARGYEVEDPTHEFEHGWDLAVRRGRQRLWAEVTRFSEDECLLQTEEVRLLPWGPRRAQAAFIADLDEILRGDERFSEIGWSDDCRW